jgi:hypothetical protein
VTVPIEEYRNLAVFISEINELCEKHNNRYQMFCKKSLKIPKGQSESVYRRRTDNTMAKRKSTKGQTTINNAYI